MKNVTPKNSDAATLKRIKRREKRLKRKERRDRSMLEETKVRAIVRHADQSSGQRPGRQSGKRNLQAINPYLHALVDPEGCDPISYPDEFDRLTATWKSIINVPLPYNNNAVGSNWPVGAFYVINKPSLINPLIYLTDYGAEPDARYTLLVDGHADDVGLFPLVNTRSGLRRQPGLVLTVDWQNLVGKANYQAGPDDRTSYTDVLAPPCKFDTPTGLAYGYPAALGAGTTAVFNVSLGTNITGPVKVRYISQDTTGATTNLTVDPNNPNNWTGTLNFVGSGERALPGVGYQICIADQAADGAFVPMVSAEVSWYSAVHYKSFKIMDEETALDLVSQYRVVSMSDLITYRGNQIESAGPITGVLYRGGESAQQNGLWSYENISQVPGSYDGYVFNGLYAFWKPSNEEDMLMREPDALTEWKHPYIVMFGRVDTGTTVEKLRLRTCINYEAITASQILGQRKPLIMPRLIEDATVKLRNFPSVMENPVHVKEIRDFLRRTVSNGLDYGGKIFSWFNDNKSWIMPAASAVGTLMMAL